MEQSLFSGAADGGAADGQLAAPIHSSCLQTSKAVNAFSAQPCEDQFCIR